MNRRPFIAGNWKMNKTLGESTQFVEALQSESLRQDIDYCLAANSLALAAVCQSASAANLHIASQNLHPRDFGAFTGETNADMLKAIDVHMSIVGHSERRQFFGDTDELVGEKVAYALKNDMTPIVCVGEMLADREAGNAEAVVRRQLNAALAHVEASAKLILAYEPVWAIGTGKTASPEDAQAMHAFIRSEITDKFGKDFGDRTLLLYGGSVKPQNAQQLLAQLDIDGALIGGASLKVESFVEIGRLAPQS